MCGSLFSTPDIPAPVAPPAPATEKEQRPGVAEEQERRRAAQRQGRQSTILASGQQRQPLGGSSILAQGQARKLGQ